MKQSAERLDLVYVCDWLPPDFGAVGQYGALAARALARSGLNVVLIGLSSHAASDTTETLGKGRLRTVKIATQTYDKGNTHARAMWTIKANTRLLAAVWRHAQHSDSILFTGSPPFFLHWIAPANVLLRKKLIYRITDFHPECTIAARETCPPFLRLLYRATLFWRRRVHQFEALGEDQITRLTEIGIDRERIALKPDPSPVEITPATRSLSRPDGAEGKVLLLYSGNWGLAHDRKTFVNAYRDHHTSGPGTVWLWLNAVGAGADAIARQITADQLPLIRGAPVSLEDLGALLVTADAHLITLSDPFVGFVLPSKVHACIASQRAILFIGSPASDVHRLCAEKAKPNYFRADVGDVARCRLALDALGARGPSMAMERVVEDGQNREDAR